MLLYVHEPTHVLIAIVVSHPVHRAVVERPAELRRCDENVERYLTQRDRLPFEIAVRLERINRVVRRSDTGGGFSTDDYKLVVEIEACVVFDRDVVREEGSATLERQVRRAGVDRYGDGACLERSPGKLERVEEAIQEFAGLETDQALEPLLHVPEVWLDRVAIRIT